MGKSDQKAACILKMVYGNRQATLEEIAQVKDIVTETGSLEYAKSIMQFQAQQANALLNVLDLREEARLFINQLINCWMLVRTRN
jgi:geranylgeranyl pyrophosphate synthase